jgi:hypothetical protein
MKKWNNLLLIPIKISLLGIFLLYNNNLKGQKTLEKILSDNFRYSENLIFLKFSNPLNSGLEDIYFMWTGDSWNKISKYKDNSGNVRYDTTKCYTCKEKINFPLLNEIAELAKPEVAPQVGCILLYSFSEKDGQSSFKSKDLFSHLNVTIGYKLGENRISVVQEDPFAAVEICPEQMARWRMLRLIKILQTME